jgi:hypothetical protein
MFSGISRRSIGRSRVTTSLRSRTASCRSCAAAEGEELADELGRAVGRGEDEVDVGHERVRRVQRLPDQLGPSHDDGEQVVEVVGDAAGKSPDRFHLLGLPELLFPVPEGFLRALAGGDLAGDREAAHDVALPDDAGEARLDPDGAAVLADQLGLEERREAWLVAGGVEPAERLARPLRGEQGEQRAVAELLEAAPGELLGAPVAMDDLALRVHQEDTVPDGLGDQPVLGREAGS